MQTKSHLRNLLTVNQVKIKIFPSPVTFHRLSCFIMSLITKIVHFYMFFFQNDEQVHDHLDVMLIHGFYDTANYWKSYFILVY